MVSKIRQGKARTGEAGQGRALQDEARSGRAGQGKAKPEWQRVLEKQRERRGEKRRRGRPEKPLKIDDSPRNVARALFGMPPLKEE